MKKFFDRILNVNTPDPEDTRKRKLLNYLLLGALVIIFINIAAITVSPTLVEAGLFSTLMVSLVIFFFGTIGIYYLNRRSGRWAAFVFLLLLTLVINFMDSPQELSHGRSIFLYTFPITVSSLLLFPSASFIFTIVSMISMTILAYSVSDTPDAFTLSGFVFLALVSWLTARSLEAASRELRSVNQNLDHLVTERTTALAEALSRERIEAGRNQAILNSIADGVVVFDTAGRSILANPALAEMIGTPLEQIAGKNFTEFIQSETLSPSGRGAIIGLIETPPQSPISYRVEWGKKTLAVNSAIVQDLTGKNIGSVAVFRDNTREVEVERMKSTFMAIVSHELRTPLNAVIGYAEMIQEAVYGPVNEKQANLASRIVKNTRRLLGLINDLLDQAQIEAGKMSIRIQPVKISDLIDGLHNTMDNIAAEKGLTLTSFVDPTMPPVINGDLERLQQVLINLVNNSIKFTKRGSVEVRILRHTPADWGIEVTDTGIGIPEDELPNIFDTFHQIEKTDTREHGGVGLGLSIVQQLVSLMGGEISVISKPGEGSTFKIILPFKIKNDKGRRQ